MNKRILSVFTEKYTKIENRLLNKVVLCANEIVDQALAQWDTGATNTCISEEIASRYKLKPISYAQSKTPSGVLTAPIYLMDIILSVGIRQNNMIISMFINSLHLVNTHISIKVLILNMPHFMPVCFKSSFIR